MTGSWALFGDSVANGLGVRDRRYADLLRDLYGSELVDFSGSAMPVHESLSRLRESHESFDVAIIAHGLTEAIVRPDQSALRFLPSRWRRFGWMDPRPYYSRSLTKRIPQAVESAVRWRTKNLFIRAFGGTQIMDIDTFESQLDALLEELIRRGTKTIVLGPTELDPRFFPGSPTQVANFSAVAQEAAIRSEATFVSMAGQLSLWSDYLADHLHPNREGHARIARLIAEQVNS